MIDKNDLRKDLTDAFILYQQNLDNPFPVPPIDRSEIIMKFNTDHVFRAKVNSLVCGVMQIVSKHIKD